MTEHPTTIVEGVRITARDLGNNSGIRYYATPESSEYRGYADLDLRARTIAEALVKRGYRVGQTVTIGLTSGLEWADASLGVLYAGLAFVPAPVAGYGTGPQLAERVEAIARSSEAVALIADAEVLERLGGSLPSEIPIVTVEELLAEGDPEAWTPPAIDADSMAYLLFTSGSTGDPKGVIATHGTFLATAIGARDLLGSNRDATLVGWAPMHHIMGLLLQVLTPAVNGAQAVVTSTEQFQRRPLFWLQLISKHRGTMGAAGNFAFALCTQLVTDEQVAQLDLSSLKSLFSGSEPVRPETVRAFIDKFAPAGITEKMIAPAMGMTESNMISAKFPDDELIIRRFDPAQLEQGRLVPFDGEGSVEWVSCGRPSPQTSVVIIDPDTLQPVPDGTVGEIWVSSPMVSPGYFRRPDATAETFGHMLPGDDRPYMRTGDLAAFLDGQLYVTGRLKEMLIIRGRNLYPQDIEAAARTVSPAVGISAVFELAGHPSAAGIVFEVSAEALAETTDDVESLAEAVRKALIAKFSLPSLAVAVVAEGVLPRTPTGKVRRQPTRAQVESGALPVEYSRGFAPIPAPTA